MKKLILILLSVVIVYTLSSFVIKQTALPVMKITNMYGMSSNGQAGIDSLTIPQEVAANSPVIGTASGSFTGSLLAGATTTQAVTFTFNGGQTQFPTSAWKGNISYTSGGALVGGYNVAITNKTATGCTLSITNNTLLTITISAISFDVVGIYNR